MYQIWFTKGNTKVLFPIAPEQIEIKVAGSNKTINLINESEVNQIRGLKLTQISFDLRLPNNKYPFATYQDGQYHGAKHFINVLKNFKTYKTPFELTIIRTTQNEKALWDTVLNVTLESYTLKEDANNGTDVTASVELKQYKTYGTTAVKVKKKASKVTYTKIKLTTTKKKIVTSYTTKKGDNLHLIAKKVYGKYTKNNAKAIFEVNKKKQKQMDVVAAYLKKLYPKKTVYEMNATQKLPSARAYTAMTYPKGVKLTIPQNKK